MPVELPEHLPDRLTVTLWDFSWYVRAGEGDAFADLDACFAAAVERGYNTVRVCAMPFLLFGSGIDHTSLTFTPLGGEYGQRTRWYDVRSTVRMDGRQHLLDLFTAARRHDCYVILSSWEYQQSPCFLDSPAWADALFAVPAKDRADVLADALADLVAFLGEHDLADRIAFVELHNEVQGTRLADVAEDGERPIAALRPLLENAVERFRERHPRQLVTANYAGVPVAEMRHLPTNVDVAVFHPYVYGVLGELVETFALRDDERPFAQERAYAELLRPGAPPVDEWRLPETERWRARATIMRQRELYAHDWCDPAKWDRWLYDRYGEHRVAMDEKLRLWIDVAADWAAANGVPLVFGEGWVGYTPLHGTFEEGPVGAAFCERAVQLSQDVGAWGTVVCSNAAPQHPMWGDVPLQRRLNEAFLAS
ncbi:MAG: hypothetical protein J2P24_00100 [Streptosporangiales bacterium]|nr:hypothetical protein [Streptosporangiales bacterium]